MKGSTNTVAFCINISSIGRSLLSVSTFSIAVNVVSAPPTTRPNIECFPSRCLQDRNVMKLKYRILYMQDSLWTLMCKIVGREML